MEPGPFTALVQFVTLCHLAGLTHVKHSCLCFYGDSTRSSNIFWEITMPSAPGDGHSPAQRFGRGVDIADHCDGLFPLEATAAGCNLKKPWRGALNSQLLQFWGIRKSKKIVVWSHMFLSCPPASPSTPQHARHILPQATRQDFTQKTIWLSMGKKKPSVYELSIWWVQCPNPLQPYLLTVKQSMQKPHDPSWVQGNQWYKTNFY